MSRWLLILVTLVLYAVAMAAVWWVLKLTVPSLVEWAGSNVDIRFVLAAVLLFALGCWLFAAWPREPDGTFRRLSRRR